LQEQAQTEEAQPILVQGVVLAWLSSSESTHGRVEDFSVHRAELLYSVPGIYFLNNRGGYLSRNTESPYRLYLLLDRTERPRWHLYSGMCQVVQVLRADLLDAMKDCLRDLENVKLLSPDDLDILDEKRSLRQKIDKLENEDSDGHEMAA
jgi:hypothetical protein